jgi:hypothetical protein
MEYYYAQMFSIISQNDPAPYLYRTKLARPHPMFHVELPPYLNKLEAKKIIFNISIVFNSYCTYYPDPLHFAQRLPSLRDYQCP